MGRARKAPASGAIALAVTVTIVAIAFILFVPANRTATSGESPFSRARETEATYSLKFGDDFKPALASRDDLGICVELAIDVSGSMSDAPRSGGAAKYVQASQALSRVVGVLDRLVRNAPRGQVLKVGLVRFNQVVEELLAPTTMDAEGIARLARLVGDPKNLSPGGSTAIGDAIQLGAARLSQAGTILRSLIVVTDGENTSGTLPAWSLSALYGNRNSASTPDFPVYTSSILVSFIGFDVDSGTFEPMSRYGARVLSATDRSGLESALSGLLEADVTKLEAPALGGGK
jgi:hypothetical protein